MQYIITFLEGIVSFISPCMLPMLPVYISYFAAGGEKKRRIFACALSFTAGFTLVFCLLGLFAGALGAFLSEYRTAVNIFCGAVTALFGLSYLGLFELPFFKGMKPGRRVGGVLSAFLFGVVYSVSLTPCVGAFLGSALMLASASGTALRGLALLVCYSLGLGLPFIFSAFLLDRLSSAFDFIKKHYGVINTVCGIFLIAVGILTAFGMTGALVSSCI